MLTHSASLKFACVASTFFGNYALEELSSYLNITREITAMTAHVTLLPPVGGEINWKK